ncbi:hypothetical protein CDIK_2465 [Cucumispora dikerogammari]|nr:hypothetical protein CDIK_2465 [Cucumispora dikerogammari]
MHIMYTPAHTIALSVNYISNTQQYDEEVEYITRTTLLTTQVITSDNLDDLYSSSLDIQNIKPEDLKLKPGKSGNCLLFPLFEVKYEDENKIKKALVEARFFNKLGLENRHILPNLDGFEMMADSTISIQSTVYIRPDIKLRPFIFKDIQTDNLRLYLYVIMPTVQNKKLTFKNQMVFYDGFLVKNIHLKIWGELFETHLINVKDKEFESTSKTNSLKEYTETNNINVLLKFKSRGRVELRDTNISNKYITIKDIANNNKTDSNIYNAKRETEDLTSKIKEKIYTHQQNQTEFEKNQEAFVSKRSEEPQEEADKEQNSLLQETHSTNQEIKSKYTRHFSETFEKDSETNNFVTIAGEAQDSKKIKEEKKNKNLKRKIIRGIAVIAIVLVFIVVVVYTRFSYSQSSYKKKTKEL